MRLNIPALEDLKMVNTRHRLPMPPDALGTYTEGEKFHERLSDYQDVYRMEVRHGVQRAIPCEALDDYRDFMECQMRRELGRHLYGNLLETLREAERAARFEGATQTQQWLTPVVKGLAALMEGADG